MLTEGNWYPFTMLREEIHLLSAIAHSETRLPCLLWNHNRTVLQVDGSPLIIGAIRHMASSLLCQAQNIITSLCEGVNMSAYNKCLKTQILIFLSCGPRIPSVSRFSATPLFRTRIIHSLCFKMSC
jgi:hypothetical protein